MRGLVACWWVWRCWLGWLLFIYMFIFKIIVELSVLISQYLILPQLPPFVPIFNNPTTLSYFCITINPKLSLAILYPHYLAYLILYFSLNSSLDFLYLFKTFKFKFKFITSLVISYLI
jgi:hypothetical protein